MILELKNINHQIDNKQILNDINLTFEKGIYALLGLNGAGKTTLINILSTLYMPSKGEMIYDKIDVLKKPSHLQQDLGYMSQNIGLIQDFTVEQNLYYFGLLKGCNAKELKQKIITILNDFDLTAIKNTKISNLSGGVKQRIGIALALINSPKIIILDEPLNNLDRHEREKLYFLLKEVSKNCIIIISTHLIDEIETVCDKVIFMKEGVITYFGNLNSSFDNINLFITENLIEPISQAELNQKFKLIKTREENNQLIVRHFVAFSDAPYTPNIEDAFVYYTKYNK
jgi:ABC-2 type transport system ATP-binding protein